VDPVMETDDLDNWVRSYPDSNERPNFSKASGTVKGTFDDLSDDEKTKAFLQLLEYKLRLEKEEKEEKEKEETQDDSFHELWQRLPSHQVKPDR